jgi:ATP-dependent phosphofructokinase / diphosphate-dependent phosphofructokinase
MKIAICTGGGDCPGLNAVIRAVVKHATAHYDAEVWGIKDSFNGIMKEPHDIWRLDIEDVSEILTRGGTILGTTNAGNPFTGENNDKALAVMQAFKHYGFDAAIVIGGDGTQTISARFAEMGMPVVGIPKTIDNDLASTEVSIGFQTCVDIATDAISRLKSTAESHDRIMVLELMGRDAGYIALYSGIAGGANVVLIPEIPYSYDAIIEKIEMRKKLGRYFSIVVVAEGAYEQGSQPVFKREVAAKYTKTNLGGIGSIVAEELFKRTGMDTRITVLGHVQRGGSPVPYDRLLASQFGVAAVDYVMQKRFGVVLGIKDGVMQSTPLADIMGKARPLPGNHPMIRTAEGIGINLGRKAKL